MVHFNSNVLKHGLTGVVFVFNVILVGITIHNLSSGLALDTYVGVSYLLCILSMLSIGIIVALSCLDYYKPRWSDFELAIEVIWVSMILLFQLISAAAMSGDSVTRMCANGTYVLPWRKQNICPSHSAILAFSWMAFIFLLARLAIVILTLLRVSSKTRLPIFTVLTTQTSRLPTTSGAEHNDLEKTITASSWSSHSSRRKQPPPPLDLSKISSTSLPIFAAHAKTTQQPPVPPKDNNAPHQATKSHNRNRTKSDSNDSGSRLSRHEIMRAHQPQGASHVHFNQPASPSSSHRQRSASLGSPITANPWQPPQDWNSSVISGRGRRPSQQEPSSFHPFTPPTAGSQDKSLPAVPPAVARPSIMDRPHPRGRRAGGPGEIEGSFWLHQAEARGSWA
ncbi:hypothetical protein FRC03_007800 [Tulasnella sp. 419]|nr:hypothetical protein FRC03_007800 [Tulasnella sp. 419]